MLATAARDLANDNIMCAVMLTGVMLLQVSRQRVGNILMPGWTLLR